MSRPPTAFLRVETTGEQTGGVVGKTAQKTTSELGQVKDFFGGIYGYLTSAEFIANVIVTVLIVTLGVLFYEVLARGVPRLLSWRRRRGPLDPALVARIKRQDTAITLARNALRNVVFVIVALYVVGIFMRNA